MGEACTIVLRNVSTPSSPPPLQLPPVFQLFLTASSPSCPPVRCGVGRGVHHRAARCKHTHPSPLSPLQLPPVTLHTPV